MAGQGTSESSQFDNGKLAPPQPAGILEMPRASRHNSILVTDGARTNYEPSAHPHFSTDATENRHPRDDPSEISAPPSTAPSHKAASPVADPRMCTSPPPEALKQMSDPRIQHGDGKLHILLGATGSMHTSSLKQLVTRLIGIYGDRVSIQVVITTSGEKMLLKSDLPPNVHIWHDANEWDTWKSRSDPVLHIELRRWADILVIAPLSANSLGKIALGLCDNLLTNIVRAWNPQYPILVAPAMVAYAYNNPATKWHLSILKEEMKWIEVLRPTEKVAGSYGGIGMGGMMPWTEILENVVHKLGGYPEEDNEDEDGDGDGDGYDGDEDDDDDDDDVDTEPV